MTEPFIVRYPPLRVTTVGETAVRRRNSEKKEINCMIINYI